MKNHQFEIENIVGNKEWIESTENMIINAYIESNNLKDMKEYIGTDLRETSNIYYFLLSI